MAWDLTSGEYCISICEISGLVYWNELWLRSVQSEAGLNNDLSLSHIPV